MSADEGVVEVSVDPAVCIGSGLCAATAPAHFRLEQGVAVPIEELVTDIELVQDVSLLCPVSAIAIGPRKTTGRPPGAAVVIETPHRSHPSSPSTPRGAPALSVRELSYRYGSGTALDQVSIDVAEGEICALVGRNGAGKSTLASIVAGLRTATAGSVSVLGTDLSVGGVSHRADIGFAPQEISLYKTLSVRENLTMFGELYGLKRSEVRSRIVSVSGAFGLEEMQERVVQRLSGGEQRRVHSAAALLHRPRLVLLDEPTAGVDIQTRHHLLEAVRTVAAEDGTAVLYATHYLPEVDALGATVAILDQGRVLARGSVADLASSYAFSGIELSFAGPVPDLPGAERGEGVLRVASPDPAALIPALLQSLEPLEQRLTNLRVVEPDLEGAFLALTGAGASQGTER